MWTMDEEGSLSVSVVKIERTNESEGTKAWMVTDERDACRDEFERDRASTGAAATERE